MSITWKLEITRASEPNGSRSIEQTLQFEADTIGEAKEKADDKISRNEILSARALSINWQIHPDKEKNLIVRVYHRGEDERSPLEIPAFPEWYVTIEPLGISLSEIRDYPITANVSENIR